MRLRHGVLAAAAVAVAAALAACSGTTGQGTPASNGQSFVSGTSGTTMFGGNPPAAPRVTGKPLGGCALTRWRSRVPVRAMTFWGPGCRPGRAEARALPWRARLFSPAGVRFLGVDIRDTPASAEAFQRDFKITYPSLNDPGDVIALAFRSTVPPAGIPTTLVISRGGRISARVIGEASYSGLRRLISTAMAGPA